MRKLSGLRFLVLSTVALSVASGGPGGSITALSETLVVTQVPVDSPAAVGGTCGEGSRIVLLEPGSTPRVLTAGFAAACDPEISFDGARMLFAGKRSGAETWDIFEMSLGDGVVRRITHDAGNCRRPVYQGSQYTIDADAPWHQISFVSDLAGELEERAPVRSTDLYSCRLDGSDVRRLTFNPSSDMDPTMLPDGRLLFSSRRSDPESGERVGLFAAQTDGIDYAVFSAEEGGRVKRSPCVTSSRSVVFVEGDGQRPDGAGQLASVSLRRNLHSYREITAAEDGLFAFPSPLPDGNVLASRRPDKEASWDIVRVDVDSGAVDRVFDDPAHHDIQARVVAPRPEPDGRSSVVDRGDPNGVLYALDVYVSDLDEERRIPRGMPVKVRIVEGVPRTRSGRGADVEAASASPLTQRVLGVAPVEDDGSFNIRIPADIPIRIQLLDTGDRLLRSCGWIWVRNHETRGCIGCHEDGERTPDNRFVEALSKPSVDLDAEPQGGAR